MRTLRNILFLSLLAMTAWRLEMEHEQMHPGLGLSVRSVLNQARARLPDVHAASGGEMIYFAPADNLERLDVGLIDGAQRSVDVAMYAFTDRFIAQALVRAAGRGIGVRVYRDRSQFEEERSRRSQVEALLSNQSNIHIRIKGSDELMHEKAMLIDGSVLRDGSGNWSVSAARYQDNQVSVTHSSEQIEAFERDFTAMWSRTDNLSVQ